MTMPVDDAVFGDIRRQCVSLGLTVSVAELDGIVRRMTSGSTAEWAQIGIRLSQLSSTIHSELASRMFLYVEKGRERFWAPEWLEDAVEANFPTGARELKAAGRCYALGEPDASVFHSMRSLEVCLRVLCDRFGIDPEGQWEGILNKIEASIREIGRSKVQGVKKTPQDAEDEHYFGKIAIQLRFFKNGWRNYVMHLKENYADREAKLVLENAESLFLSASKRLKEKQI
jgi:HEPN domain-containing protein